MRNSSDSATGQLAKVSAIKQETFICLESYRILDLKSFISCLESLIKDYEAFLTAKPSVKTFCEVSDEEQVCVMRVKFWSQFNRYRMQLLRQDEAKFCVEIFMKNGFESHGNIIDKGFFALLNGLY